MWITRGEDSFRECLRSSNMNLLKWTGDLRRISSADQAVVYRNHSVSAVPEESPPSSFVVLPCDSGPPPQAVDVTRYRFDRNRWKIGELCLSAQCISKHLSLDLTLFRQGDVLIVAPTAGAREGARWQNPMLRRGQDLNDIPACNLPRAFCDLHADPLTGDSMTNKKRVIVRKCKCMATRNKPANGYLNNVTDANISAHFAGHSNATAMERWST
jgi:hypothetical protein